MMNKALNIKKKSVAIRLICIVCVLLFLASCVKDELHNTPHPDRGAVTVSLTGLAADRAEGFTFDGRMAQVHTEDGKTRADGVSIIPLPGYLKSVSREITVTADDTLRVSLVPQQRVRDLHIEFTVTQGRPELIQSVTATLGGIAGAFDMEAEQTVGEPVSTVFAFTREGSKLTADLRLLGTMGDVQTLVLDIVFTDGGRTQHTEVELTEAMKEFNGDMTTAYRVTGTLETPVGMEEGKGEITGWETGDGGDVSAEM